jgi:hypothetical protein
VNTTFLLVIDENGWVGEVGLIYSIEADCIAFIFRDFFSWIKPATKKNSLLKPAGSVKFVVFSLRGK